MAGARRRRAPPVPTDPALPRLPELLDPDAMAPFLLRALEPGVSLTDARVRHLRYAPGSKLTVRYDVATAGRRYDAVAMIAARPYLARRAVEPENLALADVVAGRSPARMPLRFEPELEVLIQWYPLDLELPALAQPPARLTAELEAAGLRPGDVDGEPPTLAYRPGRRAVLRMGDLVLKLYARKVDFAVAMAGLAAAARVRGVRVASPVGYLPARLVAVQSLLPGSPPTRPFDVAHDAGALLRELHATPTPSTPARDGHGHAQTLAFADRAAAFVAAILPPLGVRARALVRDLEAGVPPIDRLVVSHGDFSARQLLVTADGLAVVDPDAMCLAPAALDPATYAAHLVFGGPDDLDRALDALERLLEGYGGRPPAVSWYVAACILRHARAPFRYLDEHWPERVEGMLAAAETALRR